MGKTCDYILNNNKFCKNYSRFNCNINKQHSLCSKHGIMVLGYYANIIQNYYKKTRLKNIIENVYNLLPFDIKGLIIDEAVYYIRMQNVYSLYAKFISKRINISINTIDFYKLFYTRYTDVYNYFTDNDSLKAFCEVLILIKKYFCVIKNKINFKNIRTICNELEKIYMANCLNMSDYSRNNWLSVMSIIETLPKQKNANYSSTKCL